MFQEIKDIVFVDIETVGMSPTFDELDPRLKQQWIRKAGNLRRDDGVTEEQLFESRAGIYAEFGKIVCVAVGKFFLTESKEVALKTKTYHGHNESELLTQFRDMTLRLDPNTKFCAHNGKEFDYPYLCRRMLINGIELPPLLNLMGRKTWEVQHLDTMEMWKFGDYKHYTSLELLAAIFGVPTSKNNIDGSMVNEVYYRENDLNRIADYCQSDVVVLAQLYLKMKSLPSIVDSNVISA